MFIMDRDMLWRQFSAAIDALRDALRDCPDGLWERQLWDDQPDQWVAAGFSKLWKTSLFPKDGRFIVPIRANVRKAEHLEEGDQVAVRLEVG